MTDTPRRRRWPWILLAVVVALPLAGFVALRAFVQPEAIRPRLVAAVEQATGRRFTLGDIRLALSLRPSVELRDVVLANAEGGSRPEMATARRVEVQVALLPLLSSRVEIARVVVEQPDILLETDAQGRGNWEFRPAAAPSQPSGPAEPSAPAQPLALDLGALRLEGARITWRDGRAGTAETVEIPALDASAPLAGPTTARGTLRLRGQEMAVEATTGALAALGGAAPFPYDLRLAVAGAEMRGRGQLAGAAWTAELEARVPDLARLAPLLPDAPLPPLRDVAAGARLAGTGASLTGAEALALRVGASDLSVLRPGLALTRAEATAPRLDAPATFTAEGTLGAAPLRLSGSAGRPALLLGGASGPMPLDLRLDAAGAVATIQGTIRDPRAVAGVDLALAAQVPDLAALAPLAGAPLPAIRDIRAEARLAERTPGFQGGAHLRGLRVTSAPAEAAGELTLVVGERPGVTGRLDLARLDLDAIRAAMPAAPAQPASPPQGGARPAGDGRVIPDLPLPAGALRSMESDLRLAVATLTSGGETWRDLTVHIRLQAGKGTMPISVASPAGAIRAELSADASGETPSLRLVATAPRLDLAALQRTLGQALYATGEAELEADLRGAGAGLRAVAASVDGHLGLAVLDATLEPALTGPVQAALRARVPILPALPDRLPVECVAIRAEAADGVVRLPTMLADAPAAKVAGSGRINLGDETLALRFLHDVRAAGTSVRVAADVGGTLANPGYRGVQAQNLGELLGGLAGQVGGSAGALLGALAGPRGGAGPEPLPDCGPALAAARGGREGRVPAPRPAPAAQAAPSQAAPTQPAPQPAAPTRPADLLRGLLGR